MGEVDGVGGEGGAPRVFSGGIVDGGGEPMRAAERGVSAEGERVREEAGDAAARRWGTTRFSLLLPNGSRIVGLPGTEATVRGFFVGVADADR